MDIERTDIEGLVILKPRVFVDDRGSFEETFKSTTFRELGIPDHFVQDNQAISTKKGVLRGLHFQRAPHEQGKLVRVVVGRVLDVVVDIRKDSKSYGQWRSFELSAENKKMLYVPEGLAHGFLTLVEYSIFVYKMTRPYNKESEGGIIWNDPDLNIKWGVTQPILSEKDSILPRFKEL